MLAEQEKSEDYSSEMQTKMGTALTYVHEAGMNHNRISDDIIVGSCPQTPADIDRCGHELRWELFKPLVLVCSAVPCQRSAHQRNPAVAVIVTLVVCIERRSLCS